MDYKTLLNSISKSLCEEFQDRTDLTLAEWLYDEFDNIKELNLTLQEVEEEVKKNGDVIAAHMVERTLGFYSNFENNQPKRGDNIKPLINV